MGAVSCIVCGVITLLLGILVILAGTIGVEHEVPILKNDYLIIDSKSSPQYKNWAGGYDEQVEYDLVFYFYNLTNAEDVRQFAQTPIYTTLGPYVYRRYRQSTDVSFPNGGSEVQFTDYREYQFNQNKSVGSRHDYIVNVNPVYLSAIEQAGDEQHLLGGAAGGYFKNYTTYFTGEFISLYTSFVLPGYLSDAANRQIALINETLRNSQASIDYFLDAWCNGTNTTIGNWTGLVVGRNTGISKTSAAMLFDPSILFSLLNTETNTSWAWARSQNDSTYADTIMKAFDITYQQVTAIWKWRTQDFGPTFIYQNTKQKYNLTDISDLGWVQWSAGYDVLGGTVAAPVSIHDIFPTEEIGYYGTVELFLQTIVDPPIFSWQDAKRVLNPNIGLGNITIYQIYALAMGNRTNQTNYGQWGMTQAQAEQLYTYAFFAGYFQVQPALLAEYGDSGGLILGQTVDDWVFNCNYFLIGLLLEVPQPCSLLLNASTYNTALIYSGKKNISQINQYVEWNGMKNVTGVWAEPLPVIGSTELGQFAPDQTNETVLQTFDDNLVRTVSLKFNSTSVVQQIDTNRFVLDTKAIYAPNPFFFQSIPWFANMTTFKQAPIFFSMCDMLYVNETYRNKIIGLDNTTTEANCTSYVDVEPQTGNTMQVLKKIQANMYIPAICNWCNSSAQPSVFGNVMQSDIFFPFVKAGEQSTITEELAAEVRSKLAQLHKAPHWGLIAGLSVGSFLVVLGITLSFVGYRKKRQESAGYASIPGYTLATKRF